MSATPAAGITETRRHRRLLERARDREEPTRIRSVRQRYAQRLRGAWADIRVALRRGLVENDALGAEALTSDPTRSQFDFDTDTQTAEAFTEWLEIQTERDILQRFGDENQFVSKAYERGVEDAQAELTALEMSQGRAGATALRLPVHRDQLRSLYARSFNELEGMTDAVATDLRRELTEGLAAGEGPRDIASDLTDIIGRVEDGTPRGAMNRATTIARSEVMASHNRARAVEWERAGVQKVGLLIANTACPQCQALKTGEPYDISEAHSLVPARTHPNCRCSTHVWTGN
jgi:SPP1 gp7 family putative phage head morphogenesis protein